MIRWFNARQHDKDYIVAPARQVCRFWWLRIVTLANFDINENLGIYLVFDLICLIEGITQGSYERLGDRCKGPTASRCEPIIKPITTETFIFLFQ